MKLELKAFQTSLCCSLFIEQKYSFLKVQVENFKILNEKVKNIDYINDFDIQMRSRKLSDL